jgi:hypothetical protein
LAGVPSLAAYPSSRTAEEFASPSLRPAGGPAYELKFLLDDALAAEVEAWARRRLALDPHADPALGGAYRTTTLYCDTPEHDVYRRTGSYGRRKFRLRRYGQSAQVFLERKSKRGDRVRKRRTAVPADELALLAHPLSVTTWPGHWFHRRLLVRRLCPACHVTYDRLAFVGAGGEGPLRLTLDRRLAGWPAGAWTLTPAGVARPFLTGHLILEFKYRAVLPAPFKELIGAFRLGPAPVSKYRLCLEAWGLAPAPGRTAHA